MALCTSLPDVGVSSTQNGRKARISGYGGSTGSFAGPIFGHGRRVARRSSSLLLTEPVESRQESAHGRRSACPPPRSMTTGLLDTLVRLHGIASPELRPALDQAADLVAEALDADKVDVFLHEAGERQPGGAGHQPHADGTPAARVGPGPPAAGQRRADGRGLP